MVYSLYTNIPTIYGDFFGDGLLLYIYIYIYYLYIIVIPTLLPKMISCCWQVADLDVALRLWPLELALSGEHRLVSSANFTIEQGAKTHQNALLIQDDPKQLLNNCCFVSKKLEINKDPEFLSSSVRFDGNMMIIIYYQFVVLYYDCIFI